MVTKKEKHKRKMNDKYKNKYRIQSTRLQNWDYRWCGAYFITICTHNRVNYFGEIVDGVMNLSEIGKIVKIEWLKTFKMRPDMNLAIGEYVVMPNHFHAIIVIGENQYNSPRDINRRDAMHHRDAMHCVSTNTNNNHKNRFGPQSKNLASIIRGFKIGVTKNARKINPNFAWQSRYWDHIIRNEKEYKRILQYILENPAKWENDRLNGVNGNFVMETHAEYNSEIWVI